jgi:hypothetical protein
MWQHKCLTHIPGHGIAVFKFGAEPVLSHFAPEPAVPHVQWIKNHDITVECISNCEYLHLDIRVPYGTELTDRNVEQSLLDVLGSRRAAYGPSCWHEFFREDTKQGTSYRVFITLGNKNESQWNADFSLPAETAVLALAGRAVKLFGKTHCQLFYKLPQGLYSVLLINHSPFHLLRLTEGKPAEVCARLKKHALFGISAAHKIKKMPLAILPASDDEFSKCLGGDAFWEILPAVTPSQKSHSLLHKGLALAAGDMDLIRHSRTLPEVKYKNSGVRGQNRLIKTGLATGLLCLLILSVYIFRFKAAENRLSEIESLAAVHKPVLTAIQRQRQRQQALVDSLQSFKPIWLLPTPWHKVFQTIDYAMPSHSGIDGFSVQTLPNGKKSLQFKAWVRASDWDSVSVVQHRLEKSPLLVFVKLSEQRHNLARNIVDFHVSCQLERY